ncbi:MAG: hypothetical protein ACO3AD_13865, partial [Burkholderiaceae bacterium]
MNGFKDPRTTWNNRYSSAEGMLFGAEPNGWLAAQRSRLPAGGRVLCPADGDGRNGVWLASLGLHAIAFDVADVGVEHAGGEAVRRAVLRSRLSRRGRGAGAGEGVLTRARLVEMGLVAEMGVRGGDVTRRRA